MKLEDVIALAHAGYSADQIAKLEQAEKKDQKKEDPAPKQEEKKEDPAPKQEEKKEDPAKPKTFDDVYNLIAGFTAGLQKANILGMSQDVPAQESAEDIIANIINPPQADNKGGRK